MTPSATREDLPLDYLAVAEALRHDAVRAHSHALWVVSAEICQESRAAIATSKVRVARGRIEVARLRETIRSALIARGLRERLAAA